MAACEMSLVASAASTLHKVSKKGRFVFIERSTASMMATEKHITPYRSVVISS